MLGQKNVASAGFFITVLLVLGAGHVQLMTIIIFIRDRSNFSAAFFPYLQFKRSWVHFATENIGFTIAVKP